MNLEKCKAGKHPLIVIHTGGNDCSDAYSAVRWCPVCGAVVVDTECDGRTYPGRVAGMRLPKITLEKKNGQS